MKSRALNIGFLRLMTSAIDAPELNAVKNGFYSRTQTTSNPPTSSYVQYSPIFGNSLLPVIYHFNEGVNYWSPSILDLPSGYSWEMLPLLKN